ncbi:carotenoid oxygenase family protein [Nostoc sp. CHAB 5836]|uniref:carotenoid oxygenase family protein n=1 Tax=Nostoc sp. CHAB 5836 TaxID=2780404 RepID=UPI001E565A69|nr:carotenoid oxygenase family protein [Nostoc sp. CHAB 5836]MCC5614261.1 carotenoid oxygenase family protein [Nostoc sp. CHAB 5836]
MTTNAKLSEKTWSKAIERPGVEFGPVPLSIISGNIPSGLQGCFYCNGSGRLERGEKRVGHLFDGDGAILKIDLSNETANGIYRYVRTAEYLEEERSGKLSFLGYGTMPSSSIWNRFFKPVKNVANTSVLLLPDKLLALWEGGHPYALNLENLDTIGIDNLYGLTPKLTYSAHPKQDPLSKRIYNFGLSYGKNTFLNIYCSDSTGRIVQKSAIKLGGAPIVHDFVLAGKYLIFLISPVRLDILPWLMKLKSFSENLLWKPELGTQILVIDRDNLNLISRDVTEPWFQWHFGNGYLDYDGSVVFDFVRYSDFKVNQYLREAATGYTHTPAKGELYNMRLNPQTSKVIEIHCLFDRCCDFPTVNPNQVGQHWDYTYLSVLSSEANIEKEIIGGELARFDYKTNTHSLISLGKNVYGTPPIYAQDLNNPTDAWILTVIFNSNIEQSEFWILDANNFNAGVICRIALPEILPIGFHGAWNPKS